MHIRLPDPAVQEVVGDILRFASNAELGRKLQAFAQSPDGARQINDGHGRRGERGASRQVRHAPRAGKIHCVRRTTDVAYPAAFSPRRTRVCASGS